MALLQTAAGASVAEEAVLEVSQCPDTSSGSEAPRFVIEGLSGSYSCLAFVAAEI